MIPAIPVVPMIICLIIMGRTVWLIQERMTMKRSAGGLTVLRKKSMDIHEALFLLEGVNHVDLVCQNEEMSR